MEKMFSFCFPWFPERRAAPTICITAVQNHRHQLRDEGEIAL